MENEVLELKKKALLLKREGNLDGARELLAQARDLELSSVSVQDTEDPAILKKLAVVHKRKGDLEMAKAALLKAKQIEARAATAKVPTQAPTEAQSNQTNSTPIKQVTPSPPPAPPKPSTQVQVQPPTAPSIPQKQTPALPPKGVPPPTIPPKDAPAPPSYAAASSGIQYSKPSPTSTSNLDLGHDEDTTDPDLLASYNDMNEGGSVTGSIDLNEDDGDVDMSEFAHELESDGDGDKDDDDEDGGSHHSFTDDELIDLEMLKEMYEAGMEVPSQELYEKRILENKQQAVSCKRAGDIESAKDFLRKAKTLEAALEKIKLFLESGAAGDGDSDLEGLNDSENDEISSQGEGFSMEDMMDPEMLAEMMSIGMKCPTAEDLYKKAEKKKLDAVKYKKEGNIEKAKECLKESKLLQQNGDNLARALQKQDGGSDVEDDLSEGELEKRLLGDEEVSPPVKRPNKVGTVQPVSTPVLPTVPKPALKSSSQLKQEAIDFKKANQLKEAAAAFREYKIALAREANEARQKQIDLRVRALKEELEFSKEQSNRWSYMQVFYDSRVPSESQMALWLRYSAKITGLISAAPPTTDDGSIKPLVRVKGSLLQVKSGGTAMLPSASGENGIDIAMVGLLQMNDNKYLPNFMEGISESVEKCITLQVQFDLPESEENPDCTHEINFQCQKSDPEWKDIKVMELKSVAVARGQSRLAKMVLRRMQRKKMTINVLFTTPSKSSEKGFWGYMRSKKQDIEPPQFLGKVVIELATFLTESFVSGDFPLLDKLGKKESGGFIRLAISCGSPFDSAAHQTAQKMGEKNIEAYLEIEE